MERIRFCFAAAITVAANATAMACEPQSSSVTPAAAPSQDGAVVSASASTTSASEPDAFAQMQLESLRPLAWSAWPTARPHITSYFGPREDPVAGERVYLHRGVDFRGKTGDPVLSIASGRVVTAELDPLLGNLVVIDHGGGLMSYYGHQSKLLVGLGQLVTAGTPLGEVGSTGRSQAPHLHFAVKQNGVTIDPLPWLRAPFPAKQ